MMPKMLATTGLKGICIKPKKKENNLYRRQLINLILNMFKSEVIGGQRYLADREMVLEIRREISTRNTDF